MLVFEAGWNESLVWRQRGWGSTDDPFNSACLIYELSFMGEEAADAQSQLGASPRSPLAGQRGHCGQGPAASGAALLSPPWGRGGCHSLVWAMGASCCWAQVPISQPTEWLKCSETHRKQ